MLCVTDHEQGVEVPVGKSFLLDLDRLDGGPLHDATRLSVKVGVEAGLEQLGRVVRASLVLRKVETVETRCQLNRLAESADETVRHCGRTQHRPDIPLERDYGAVCTQSAFEDTRVRLCL